MVLKKVIIPIFCAIILFSLAGCGSEKDKTNSILTTKSAETLSEVVKDTETKTSQLEATKAPEKPSDKITYVYIVQELKKLEEIEKAKPGEYVDECFVKIDKDLKINKQLQDLIISQMKVAYAEIKEPKFDEVFLQAYKKALKVQSDNNLAEYQKELDAQIAKKDAELAASDEAVKKSEKELAEEKAKLERLEQIGKALKGN